jgi:hypothetical protein
MMHKLLCRLYFHAWSYWDRVSLDHKTARYERFCKCCGAREWKLDLCAYFYCPR